MTSDSHIIFNHTPMNPNTQQAPKQDFVFDKYVAIALVVGIVAGFIIGNSVGNKSDKDALVYGGNVTTTATTTDTVVTTASTPDMTMSLGEWLSVPEQSAGNVVTLSKLTLGKSYWVAIRDNADTTKTPFILGAKKVFAGSYTDLPIYVNRALESGKSYEVVFYNDHGDFNYDNSNLVMDGSSVLRATFNVK